MTFFEELRFDYASLTRLPFANFDNDACSCYDRIITALASLAGKKYGVHKDVIFVHAKTLEEAEFKLKTSAGISKSSYKHCVKFPLFGTGQGSTNSPTIWCFISSVLFQTHQQHAHGMLFQSPIGDIFVRYNMVGFVDDSTCITGGTFNDSFEDIKRKMTEDAQLWHDLLWVSGGKLELPKCGYHIVYYDFAPTGIPKMKVIPPNDKVILKDDKGDEVSIRAKSIYKPRLNLGHYKAPAGTRTIQTEKLKQKASNLTDNIIACNVSREEARMLFQTVWKPSIEYVIGQSFLSRKQLESIERASLPKLYSVCGFNRNTKKEILQGPTKLSGGGFTPLHATVSAAYVLHIIRNWQTGTEDLGKIIRICYAWSA